MSTRKRLVVIDGKSVFYRGYYAMPNLATKDGTPTGGVYGFAVMALEVIKKMDPDFICIAWDKSKTNIRRRKKIYPEYKAGRKPPPPDFYEQIPLLRKLLEAFNWPLYEIDDHEADDIMGTFSEQARRKGYETLLITSDLDVLQLVNGSTNVCALKKGLTNTELFDTKHFKDKYSMDPRQFIDFKALRGDSSDNIPGVKGIGEKTASKLIKKYKDLSGVYKHLDEIDSAIRTKLEKDKNMAYLSKELVTLDLNIELPIDWEHAKVSNINPKDVVKTLRELEFRTLINQLPDSFRSTVDDVIASSPQALGVNWKAEEINNDTALSKLKLPLEGTIVMHVMCKGPRGAQLQKCALVLEGTKAVVINADKCSQDALRKTFKSVNKSLLIGYDTKTTIEALEQLGVAPPAIKHDVHVGAYLINSLERDQSLTGLVRSKLGIETSSLDEVAPENYTTKAPGILDAIVKLYDAQRTQLEKSPKLLKLATTIEWPFIPVLARMETAGIKLDTTYLNIMSTEVDDIISDIEQQIYGYANREFNIASPTQLAEVLFEDLSLPTMSIKKGKTGLSTAASELSKLRLLHPIIDLISQYREVAKLKNTYIAVLPKLVDKDSKLHTTFSLTAAPTGRLSSHDPNLQNIPIRSEIGKKIRQAFVPHAGNVFVSADYSQFELRLAAALADDKELIREFNEGLDIHTQTAALINNVVAQEVTKDQRRQAKVINFGILYGMSPHGLSVATGMSQQEARDYIKRYFEFRKPLLEYIEKTRQQARDNGFVETLFGRRRPTPDVKSSNWVVRQAAERAAINMPIQGTEADIMKMAMIKVQKHLDRQHATNNTQQTKIPRMLLQIHDSILVECPKEEAKEVGKLLKDIMENIYKLAVNLDVDIAIGKNWGEL